MFKKILVANRGEIALRILTACRELGVRSVAVYSEIDHKAPWTRLADESYPLKGVSAAETYLNQEAILECAITSGVDAIHPGYGFLSENADFAAACAERGIVFIGPPPHAMRILGSKTAARLLAQRAGVPVVPGTDVAGQSDADLITTASAIGFPILIKASAGGGGKGMRVVRSEKELEGAVQAARREARSAFGNDHLLIEKYFSEVHHVEIQVLGDSHGNMLHLLERECSIQRRHQKIIEECPAPIMPFLAERDAVHQAMAEAAIALARSANYVNAGTVEFVVDASQGGRDCFYFLEMNTRLQVEHPVTELVTGLDMVSWQIRIAAGEPLPFEQKDISARGHAIECRIYAEDPVSDFLPSMGAITAYRAPAGPGVRVDSGIETGTLVTPHYDPMLAKVICWGHDRPDAIRKMIRALRDTVVLGVTTNIPYLLDILGESRFLGGRTSTNYTQEAMSGWMPSREPSDSDILALAALELLLQSEGPAGLATDWEKGIDPWQTLGGWRNVR